jgi:hypothetical protein
MGYNTTLSVIEYYNGTVWIVPGLVWQSVQTTSFTAIANNGYPVNTTSGAITVTLPASPSVGQQVSIIDYAGTSQTNNITINSNGSNIEGSSSNTTIKTFREAVNLVYVDSTQGWLPVSGFNAYTDLKTYVGTYIVVAGGGGGGSGASANGAGAGGAGGFLAGSAYLTVGTTYTITVGAGGGVTAGTNPGLVGSNSSISGIATALGGGFGGQGAIGGSGGSGGGGGSQSFAGGSGTAGQGNNGGNSWLITGFAGGGGGGGASAIGGSTAGATNGGAGIATSISGTSTTYSGGGGGGSDGSASYAAGTGGAGGGGNGAGSRGAGGTVSAGGTNTGGGGGGGAFNITGGTGGSGIVLLSVPTASYSGNYTGTQVAGFPKTNGSNTVLAWAGSGTYVG